MDCHHRINNEVDRETTDVDSPYAVEDEEELDKDTSERQDASHHDAGDRPGVECLVWDLTRDLIRPHRMLNRLRTGTSVSHDIHCYSVRRTSVRVRTCSVRARMAGILLESGHAVLELGRQAYC